MSSHTGSGADRQVVSLLNECGGPAVPLGHFGWPCSPRRQALLAEGVGGSHSRVAWGGAARRGGGG